MTTIMLTEQEEQILLEMLADTIHVADTTLQISALDPNWAAPALQKSLADKRTAAVALMGKLGRGPEEFPAHSDPTVALALKRAELIAKRGRPVGNS